MKGVDYSPLKKYHSIACNSSVKIGLDWIDICFFSDLGWWTVWGGREMTRDFKGEIVTCNPAKFFGMLPRMKQIHRGKAAGIESKMNNYIAWNRNTGFAAINLAYHFGAETIVLIGFDMRAHGRNKNWHKDYKEKESELTKKDMFNTFKRYLQCVNPIAKEAEQLGLTILNATPDSAIDRWPFVDWKDYADAA